jgi:hypothetical protein
MLAVALNVNNMLWKTSPAAREAVAPQARLRGEFPPLVLYTSELANRSIERLTRREF